MIEILLLISCFLWFGIGYALGSHVTIEDIKEKANEIHKGIQKNTPVGPVNRPTSQQVNKQQDKQAEAEEEEMERNLKIMFPGYKKDKNVN